MNKDPGIISSVLDFFSKMLDKSDQKTKQILPIERWKGEKKIIFYLVKYAEFDDKSLLEYIDSQNVRLSRQREELIDLSVKIANLNHRDDKEKAMEEVINHYKSGLSSGVGLRDMTTQIRERYPWSSSKKKIMIFVSLMTCLTGIGLYVLDLSTDVRFSLEMLKKSRNETNDFDNTLKSVNSECYAEMNFTFYQKCNRTADFDDFLSKMNFAFNPKFSRKSNDQEDYLVTAWISMWHCIQPFVVTVVVFIITNYRRGCNGVKFSLPDISDLPDCLKDSLVCKIFNYLLCCIPFKVLWPLGYLLFKGLVSTLLVLGSSVPIPALTNFYRFYLDVRCHHARSHPDFRTKIVSIEKDIRKHEVLGKL